MAGVTALRTTAPVRVTADTRWPRNTIVFVWKQTLIMMTSQHTGALLSKLYFLNYRLLSGSIDSSNSQSRPTEFGKNALTRCHGLLVSPLWSVFHAGRQMREIRTQLFLFKVFKFMFADQIYNGLKLKLKYDLLAPQSGIKSDLRLSHLTRFCFNNKIYLQSMKEKEPFYLHPPTGEKPVRRREGRESVRESVRERRGGVRFSDLSQHSHTTRDSSDRQRRDRDRDRDRDRAEKQETKAGRRSHSVEDTKVRQSERRKRSRDVETRKSGSEYYQSDQKVRDIKLKSSRSKSHDESERSNRRERAKRTSEEESYEQKSSDENQPAPFYLHSAVSQSSHNGYERIQSLFYESLDGLDRNDVNTKKTRRRSREMSPEKRGFDIQWKDPNNNNNKSSSQFSHHERRKSPKRRAAPPMALPACDYPAG